MKKYIYLPDDLLLRLRQQRVRVEGSLGFLNDKELDFHPHRRRPRRKGDALLRLPHGSAVLRDKEASLRLRFDTAAESVCVPEELTFESGCAADFFATIIPESKTGQRPPRRPDPEPEPELEPAY